MVVLESIRSGFNSRKFRQLIDMRNIVLYIFCLLVLGITWSGIKTMQNNYELQKQISTLNQQNAVLHLQTEDITLQNKYFQTNQYLDLAARQDLGLAAPGEQVMLIPKNVALKYVDTALAPTNNPNGSSVQATGVRKNIQAWRNFLLGRKIYSN